MISFWVAKNKMADGQQGFTLVEILIAMAVFVIGILALYVMQISSTHGNASARKRSLALAMTEDRLEKLANTPFTDAALNAGTTTPAANADGIDNNINGVVDEAGETGDYTILWTIADFDLSGDGANDAKAIRVQVGWTDRGRTRSTFLNVFKIDL